MLTIWTIISITLLLVAVESRLGKADVAETPAESNALLGLKIVDPPFL